MLFILKHRIKKTILNNSIFNFQYLNYEKIAFQFIFNEQIQILAILTITITELETPFSYLVKLFPKLLDILLH